jgi:hypothetical protein
MTNLDHDTEYSNEVCDHQETIYSEKKGCESAYFFEADDFGVCAYEEDGDLEYVVSDDGVVSEAEGLCDDLCGGFEGKSVVIRMGRR